MSLLNANAFYEMGIRHMIQKPIIHMYLEGGKIPFDVAPHRAIPFSYSHPDSLEAAREALKAAVEEAIKPDFRVENPVTRARSIQQIHINATPEIQVLMDDISSLKGQVHLLKTALSSRRRPARNPFAESIGETVADDFFGFDATAVSVSKTGEGGFLPEEINGVTDILFKRFGAVKLMGQGSQRLLYLLPGDVTTGDLSSLALSGIAFAAIRPPSA
jgi:hypothetical protein